MARNPAAKTGRRDPAKIADEQARALKLKLDGLSVREIAKAMSMAVSTVQCRLQAAYDDLVQPLAEEVRSLELARLDRYQRRLEERMDDGEDPVRVVPICLRVQERRARYFSDVEAPQKVDHVVDHITPDPRVLGLVRAAQAAADADLAALQQEGD